MDMAVGLSERVEKANKVVGVTTGNDPLFKNFNVCEKYF
jgi:hypothetical protein